MSEASRNTTVRARRIRHRSRSSQVLIYLGKQLRFFINESDWKVLPMAAVIAALIGMVIRKKFFINMEGSLIGAFALTCSAIWNGCFNSIQSVCRERAIIKREHRSGMHITSYVAAHMIYQFFLCTAQTALTMYVLKVLGVRFPAEGFMTRWMIVDIGLSMLLVTYAADMMSLFISSLSHTTTGAMTVMPFVLIFQLVFSGGIIPLPAWSQSLSDYTISNYGIRAVAAQSGYNELPMVTVWNTVEGMRDTEVGGTVTLGELLDMLDSPSLEKYRDTEVVKSFTVGEAAEILNSAEESLHLREKVITQEVGAREIIQRMQTDESLKALLDTKLISVGGGTVSLTLGKVLEEISSAEELQPLLDKTLRLSFTLGQVLDFLHTDELAEKNSDRTLNQPVTLGQAVDFLKNNRALQERRDQTFTLNTTVGGLLDLVGEQNVKQFIEQKTAEAARKPEYERSVENILDNWISLCVFILLFAVLSILSLKMIDRDKR